MDAITAVSTPATTGPQTQSLSVLKKTLNVDSSDGKELVKTLSQGSGVDFYG